MRYGEIELFKTHFNKPGKIVDLGCGSGRTSIHLFERGFDVDAIDYSEAMIARAKEEYPPPLVPRHGRGAIGFPQ